MSVVTDSVRPFLRPAFGAALLGALVLAACMEAEPGLPDPSQGGEAGEPSNGGSQGAGRGGSTAAGTTGQVSSGGAGEGGAAGAEFAEAGAGGAPEPAAGGAAGSAGEPSGPGGGVIAPACTFHSPPVPTEDDVGVGGGSNEGGEGGSAGAGPVPDITLRVSPFVGTYLADSAGRTLYTYGADRPGDCKTPPQMNCVTDCLVSWPPFHAGSRLLPPELSDAGFGTIQLPDQSYQTTYMGWPLYYYKTDLALGQMAGQEKGKIWHIAELTLPTITIMRTGSVKYLADAAGRTLYVSASDQAGTDTAEPVSTCEGECQQTFEAFHAKKVSAVTALEPQDISVFARSAGGLQLTYKGWPLYRATTDLKSGDMSGTAVTGFTAALP
jgi:predicted lipoprotein with Yx(FWY)xxD motif